MCSTLFTSVFSHSFQRVTVVAEDKFCGIRWWYLHRTIYFLKLSPTLSLVLESNVIIFLALKSWSFSIVSCTREKRRLVRYEFNIYLRLHDQQVSSTFRWDDFFCNFSLPYSEASSSYSSRPFLQWVFFYCGK